MKPTVYVVVIAEWGDDLSGTLIVPDASSPDGWRALWAHLSSSIEWLRSDLTIGFGDRRFELARRFPDGYDVDVVALDDVIPIAIAHLFKRHVVVG